MPRNSFAKTLPCSDFHAANRWGIHKVKRRTFSDHATREAQLRCASRWDSSSQRQINRCTCRNPDTYIVEDSQFCIGCGRPAGMEAHDPLTAETSVTTPGTIPSPKGDDHDQGTAAQESCGEEKDNAEVDWENEEEGQIFEDDWFTPIQPNPERSWPILTAADKTAPRPKYEEIRLLHIAPGLFDDPIYCTRVRTALSTANFEAVSYTWADETGNGEYSEAVTCDGIESRVTRNGASLLRHVRLTDRVRTIWMDQLCINQSDDYEKSWQVQLMPEIYEKAEEVLIFAAPEIVFPPPERNHSGVMVDSEDYDSFFNIMQLRWFSRVWVLQEVARAKRVSVLAVTGTFWKVETDQMVCVRNPDVEETTRQVLSDSIKEIATGGFKKVITTTKITYIQEIWKYTYHHRPSIPWEKFRSKILKWHQNLPSNVKAKTDLPGALNLQMQQLVPYKDLHGLLQLTRRTYSGDPRDKVFALFGIVISAAEHGLVADYTKTTELVFAETAWYIICTTNTLEILSSRHEGTSKFQVASWVPDWTKPSVRSLRSDLQNRSLWGGAHLADHQSRIHHTLQFGYVVPGFHCNCNTGELQIKGHLLDKVISINKNSLCDHIADSLNEVPIVTPLSFGAGIDCSVSLNYWDQWAKKSDRPFFRTEKSTGFCESQPEIGDEVWLLHGAEVLFVLRKHEQAYKLITECFLWGMSYHKCCWDDNCERFVDDHGSRACASCLKFREIGLEPPVDITIC